MKTQEEFYNILSEELSEKGLSPRVIAETVAMALDLQGKTRLAWRCNEEVLTNARRILSMVANEVRLTKLVVENRK